MKGSITWGLSLPYQGVAAWRRRNQSRWPRLPRPTISVGNLAFGGRGKTPLVAAIAQEALALGLHPAILTRGYGGQLENPGTPEILTTNNDGATWLQPGARARDRVGEEACWLAAACPGVPVGVSPDRARSATRLLSEQTADLFILDDGFQTATQRDIDLVLVDSSLDPPFVPRRTPLREGARALQRASALGILCKGNGLGERDRLGGYSAGRDFPCFVLSRTFRSLRRLSDGAVLRRSDWPAEVVVAAAVGQPGSVSEVLADVGIQTVRSIHLRDHSRPNPRQLAVLRSSPVPVVITEKDAISWGYSELSEALVLEASLEGASELGRWAIEGLNL